MKKKVLILAVLIIAFNVILAVLFYRPKSLYDASIGNYEKHDVKYNIRLIYYDNGKINMSEIPQEDQEEFFEQLRSVRISRCYGMRNPNSLFGNADKCFFSMEVGAVFENDNYWNAELAMNNNYCAYPLAFRDVNRESYGKFYAGLYHSYIHINKNDFKELYEKYFK